MWRVLNVYEVEGNVATMFTAAESYGLIRLFVQAGPDTWVADGDENGFIRSDFDFNDALARYYDKRTHRS